MNTILDLCLVQHVLEPTRGENILDLIFSQHPETVANVHILEPLKTSDHQMVLCDLNFNTIAPTNCSSTSNLPLSDINFKKADWNHFNELLLQIKWERILQSDSIDDLWNNFAEVITEAVLLSAPKKMHHSPRNALWETKLVRQLRVRRNHAEREYLSRKSPESKKNRNHASKELKKAVGQAIEDFETSLAANSDVKPFWHYVKSKYKARTGVGPLIKNSAGEMTENDEDCANTLSTFYSSVFTTENLKAIPFATPKTSDELVNISFTEELVSKNLAKANNFSSPGPDGLPYSVFKAGSTVLIPILCKMFQIFFNNCAIPTTWKLAHVIPIFKKGNRNLPENYRPISLTSCCCKLMESCIRDCIWDFWAERSLINPSQFGFTPTSSTSHQLLHFLDDLTTAVDDHLWADVVYLDFSKAFNSVPHERLIRKLSALGIKGNTLQWIRSFLNSRKEIVVVNGSLSKPTDMTSGVPQGSCLGPVLFLAYINDVDSCFANSIVLKYADDIKCYKVLPKNDTSARLSLQDDLNSVMKWSLDWQLNFNLSKCTSLHFGHGNNHFQYRLMNESIKQSESEKDLGILIRSDLKSTSHVSLIVQKAEKCLAVLKRNIVSRDKNIFLKLYKQLVRPILEYAVCIWNPYLSRDIDLIERVQHRATKCVKGLRSKSYNERLKALNLESLQTRRNVLDLCEVFKLLHNHTPIGKKMFKLYTGNSMCTRGHSFKLEKFQCRLDCRKHFFGNRIISLWNSLPEEVVNSSTLHTFRKRVRTYLCDNDMSHF